MDAASVSALAGVLGSLVGGSVTVATAWITQKTLRKHEWIGAEIRQRETLYAEFIRETSKVVVDALAHTLEQPDTLVSVYELINRIRLSASEAVLEEAENVLRHLTELYAAPNLSMAEIRGLVQSGA